MRLTLRLTLVVALATVGLPAHPAPDAPAEREGIGPLALTHDAVTCMVAGRHPLIEAELAPVSSLRVARVYFHSALSSAYYYVEMDGAGGRYVGTLPRPRADAGPVTYYVEGLALDHTQAQTAEVRALVVEAESECEGRVAAYLPGTSPVRVFSLSGTTALPPGFSGAGSVVATAAGAASPGTAAASTGGSGFLNRRTGALFLGVAMLGLGTVIVVSGDEEPPPASPSR